MTPDEILGDAENGYPEGCLVCYAKLQWPSAETAFLMGLIFGVHMAEKPDMALHVHETACEPHKVEIRTCAGRQIAQALFARDKATNKLDGLTSVR
jgi:hypothetical protein